MGSPWNLNLFIGAVAFYHFYIKPLFSNYIFFDFIAPLSKPEGIYE
jgi:hypothetical protein